MCTHFRTFIALGILVLGFMSPLLSQQLPFQGRLLQNGIPFTGQQTFVFSISSGGVSWAETHTNVTVAEGLYVVILGSVTPLPANLYENVLQHDLFVEVQGTPLDTVQIFAPFERDPGLPTELKDGVDWADIQGIPTDIDTSKTNELQNLSLMGDTLMISQGNFVVINPQTDSLVAGSKFQVGEADTVIQATAEQLSGGNFQGVTTAWQSFVPSAAGRLDTVSVTFAMTQSASITLNIYNGAGTATIPIYTETFPASQFTPANNLQSFTLSSSNAPVLQAGGTYTFSLTSGLTNGITVEYNDQDPYIYGISNFNSTTDLLFRIQQEVANTPLLQVNQGGSTLEVSGRIRDKTGFVMPVGTIVPYAGGPTPPEGWLFCDGSNVSRLAYPELFGAIGVGWDPVDNGTTFKLPDIRGRFLRGWLENGNSNVDPDVASRVKFDGSPAGNVVGSYQGPATLVPNNPFTTTAAGGHQHLMFASTTGSGGPNTAVNGGSNGNDFSYQLLGTSVGPSIGFTSAEPDHTHTITGGDNDTRPRNAYVMYIIKY